MAQPKSSKSVSDDEFTAQLIASRQKPRASSMVMTKPPAGPNKSLDEVLRDNRANWTDSTIVPVVRDFRTADIQRNLCLIPIALIDANPLAPREVYTPQMIKDRAEALRTQGQHDPIHVIPNPDIDGRFIIADGWTRVQACLEHKVLDELLAEIHDHLTIQQAAWFGYQQNEEREQHCDLDRAMFYEKLIASGESAAEVARKAGVSRAQMTYYRSFSKLPADVIEIIKNDPKRFGASAAYQLSKVADKVGRKQAVRLAVKFTEENHPYAWIVNQAQALMEPKANKQPLASKQVRYNNGYYKQRGDAFEIIITVDPAKRAKFASELEALLATVAEEVPLTNQTDLEGMDSSDDEQA